MEEMLNDLSDSSRPLGRFMLLGPTGIGKTETAKTVSGLLFGGRLIKVDCSEYSLPHEYAKLIGAPPGYIGHNEGGYLTGAISEQPRSVVLFDEFEKSHSKMRNILLQVLDEGRLSDSKGMPFDFTQSWIAMTSNLGVKDWVNFTTTPEFSRLSEEDRVNKKREIFMHAFDKEIPAELRNRIDHTLVYNEFNLDTAIEVSDKMIERTLAPFSRRSIRVAYEQPVTIMVASKSDYQKYGGREMDRTAKELLKKPLLGLLSDEKISNGDTVNISYKNKRLRFEVNGKTELALSEEKE